jgi:hypothetical protein
MTVKDELRKVRYESYRTSLLINLSIISSISTIVVFVLQKGRSISSNALQAGVVHGTIEKLQFRQAL